ncbi:MAG: extracellular solute-binding protein, partial [Ruminococcaceae bacterium]|nr:extracellular solute-binding protein [Oscillospiraceae bacterium]
MHVFMTMGRHDSTHAAHVTNYFLRREQIHMKNAKFLKVLALALVVCMAATVFVGCGSSEPASSAPTADGGDAFADGGDITFTDGIENSTVSTGNPNASKGDDGTISATINSNASSIDGLMVTDNEKIFKNIPKELKGKTITFADWGEASAEEYQKVVKKFEQDTGIKVRMLRLDEGTFISKVAQQIAAGSSPDIAASNSTYPQALEVVQPLPSYFDINDGFWDPRVSEATKVGKTYYFVNSYNSPFTGGYVVYYNKKIYNNNGLYSPQDYLDDGDWSYENLFKCMEDAKKLGYKGGILESMTLAEQMGVSLINYDQNTGTF